MAEGAGSWMPRPTWRTWLAVGLAVVVVVVLVVARLAGGEADDGDRRVAATPTPTGASASQGLEDDGLVGSPTPEIDPAAAVSLATEFAREWGRHPEGETAEQWSQRLVPFTTTDFAEQLALADAEQLSVVRVTGEASVRSSGPSSVVVVVPTSEGKLLVTCVAIDGVWKVGDLDIEPTPARTS